MRYLLVLFLTATFVNLHAQQHDATWILGYGGGWQSLSNDSFGLNILKFSKGGKFTMTNNQSCILNMAGSNSSLSDSTGQLLFLSNAERVYHRNLDLMQNGNNLNINNSQGAIQPQGVLALPIPLKDSLYLLLVSEIKYFDTITGYAGYRIRSNTINIFQNNNLGKVIQKNINTLVDTLEFGQITSVKHANGQDWWVLIPATYSNEYYTFLLDSSGISLSYVQKIGEDFIDGVGQSVFSPNGTKYARVNGIKLSEPNELYVYDFDRCTGFLSQPVHLKYENWGLGTGCVISPNSRYLYALNASYVFQYDLWASDIEATKKLVAEWDEYIHAQHYYTTFGPAQLAPDGKIYISTAGSVPVLHVIEYPDREGVACQVRQRNLPLYNYNSYSIPNFPNFRLGPIDGSACDTAGLDNHPLCNWRWAIEDSSTLTQVTFLDLSAYEPTTWLWDFGDGQISTEVNPVHAYAQEGVYQVCLTVANAFSTDTFCQTLHLGVVSSVEETSVRERVRVYPNPADQHILFDGLPSGDHGLTMEITAPDGKVITAVRIPSGQQHWLYPTADLTPGVYLYRMISNEQTAQSGRFVVMH